MQRSLAMIAVVATLVATSCSDTSAPSDSSREDPMQVAGTRKDTATRSTRAAPVEPSSEGLAKQGRQIYLSSCIACHDADPTKDGALGPAVSGSSRELIEARIMRGEYPEGYVPKRETGVMIAMPFLEKQIPGLAAYLAAAAR